MIFCDMPWIMTPSRQTSGIRAQLKQIWPDHAARYNRFFALGYDAFNLISRLPHMEQFRHQTHEGQTGTLLIDDDNRLTRQLSCGKFRRGLPRPL